MPRPLVIFEDEGYRNLRPLTYTRPACRLRCGMTSLAEKIAAAYPSAPLVLHVRDYIAPVLAEEAPHAKVNQLSGDSALLINGRVLAPRDLAALIPADGPDVAYECDGQIVAARVSGAAYSKIAKAIAAGPLPDGWAQGLKTETVKVPLMNYLWDLINANPAQIEADFAATGRTGIHGTVHESSVVYGPKERVYVAEGAEVQPFVCMDTRHGPVVLDAGVEVHPYTRIEGPCYVGPKSILLGAKVREGCTIGPMCRVGGEVEESIIHGYSNKYHDGFLGHAYVGEWINLGALTTNSDLKNDYGTVSIMMDGKPVDSGSTKVGSFFGDHVKTSIGTLLNTGTIVGTMAVAVATGAPLPKYITPFAWFLNGVVTRGFGLDGLIDTARIAMSRRKVTMTPAYEAMLRRLYELTADERSVYVAKGRRQMAGGR
jgi:UDP-N-acetylglucosamine diphosphorylase/glucosamine-1-phosphate N-acetyltransferase